MKTKPLGRSGLELSPFGLLVGDGASAPAPPGVSNWCDIPAEIDEATWAHAGRCLNNDRCIVLARVGPRAWDRIMLTRCTELLARVNRTVIDIWQLSMVDVDRVNASEAFRMMIRLKEQGHVRLFSIRTNSIADALWAVQHTPVHCVTLDVPYDAKQWSELLKATPEEGKGIIATTATAGGDVVRARELLASTAITAFSWPARLNF
jgi:aryl-alcohol dehydrogenase-like predicted oxidoreductase